VIDWTDYEQLKGKARELGRPTEMMIALSYNNDPFAMTGERTRRAEWVADVWGTLKIAGTMHVRRVHYIIVSHADIAWIKGGNYENTFEHWKQLTWGVRDARYLGLIPDDFEDRRNAVPIVYLTNNTEPGGLSIVNGVLHDVSAHEMPAPPELSLSPPVVDQRYHIELWAEKTTLNDVLEPIAQEKGVNLITGAGELSYTACRMLIERAKESGRPVRILYVSDFDPSGECMPVSVARKIEFVVRKEGLDTDIQVRSIALTKKQCDEFELPRVPIKETDKRGDRWAEKHSEGATEVDALEALHPGALGEIVEAEIARYYDLDLEDGVDEVAAEIESDVDDVNDTVSAEFEDKLDELRLSWDEIARKIEDWKGLASSTYQAMDSMLNERAPNIEGVEWPEPADGDEDFDPLYESRRDYVEQMERYKRHQGKPTAGLSRGGRQRRDEKRERDRHS
jgi:hypothetical protein